MVASAAASMPHNFPGDRRSRPRSPLADRPDRRITPAIGPNAAGPDPVGVRGGAVAGRLPVLGPTDAADVRRWPAAARPDLPRSHRRGAHPLRASARPRRRAGTARPDEYQIRLRELAEATSDDTDAGDRHRTSGLRPAGTDHRLSTRSAAGADGGGPRCPAPHRRRTPIDWVAARRGGRDRAWRRSSSSPSRSTTCPQPRSGVPPPRWPRSRSVAFASEELLQLGGDLVAAGHVDVEDRRAAPPRSRAQPPAVGPSRGGRGWPRSARRPDDETLRPRHAG